MDAQTAVLSTIVRHESMTDAGISVGLLTWCIALFLLVAQMSPPGEQRLLVIPPRLWFRVLGRLVLAAELGGAALFLTLAVAPGLLPELGFEGPRTAALAWIFACLGSAAFAHSIVSGFYIVLTPEGLRYGASLVRWTRIVRIEDRALEVRIRLRGGGVRSLSRIVWALSPALLERVRELSHEYRTQEGEES